MSFVDEVELVAGMDTHLDTYTSALCDTHGRMLALLQIATLDAPHYQGLPNGTPVPLSWSSGWHVPAPGNIQGQRARSITWQGPQSRRRTCHFGAAGARNLDRTRALDDFVKVEAGGNDFILVHGKPPGRNAVRQAVQACDRHHGIGADGLAWYSIDCKGPTALITMKCYNPDGTRMGSCINASRSVAFYAHAAGLVESSSVVVAAEKRLVYLSVAGNWVEAGLRKLHAECLPLPDWAPTDSATLVRLGDPHLVLIVSAQVLASDSFAKAAKRLREWRDLMPSGANVHFISKFGQQWRIRTFERGVEAETLCCGSGSISALWAIRAQGVPLNNTVLQSRGGAYLVGNYINRMWKISGEVRYVFTGRLSATANSPRKKPAHGS